MSNVPFLIGVLGATKGSWTSVPTVFPGEVTLSNTTEAPPPRFTLTFVPTLVFMMLKGFALLEPASVVTTTLIIPAPAGTLHTIFFPLHAGVLAVTPLNATFDDSFCGPNQSPF